MRISVSATNPCHLYELAVALCRRGHLQWYYSGYPRWKLRPPDGFSMRAHSGRTLLTYLINRFPARWRPPMLPLFRWQDAGFDRWVSTVLSEQDSFIHCLPGQAEQTFLRARTLGVRRVLNHASGPLRAQIQTVAAQGSRITQLEQTLIEQHEREYELADYHCCASTVVRDQLSRAGVDPARIWVIPYGADSALFFPRPTLEAGSRFRIVFAGQVTHRKRPETLLRALEISGGENWECDFYGIEDLAAEQWFSSYTGKTPVRRHGPVPRRNLAEVFRRASVLVLPSIEEAFGLVAVQALACGCPCIVSDRVGAKDLIQHRRNGAVFPAENSEALAAELDWWAAHWRCPAPADYSWDTAAMKLVELSSQTG